MLIRESVKCYMTPANLNDRYYLAVIEQRDCEHEKLGCPAETMSSFTKPDIS